VSISNILIENFNSKNYGIGTPKSQDWQTGWDPGISASLDYSPDGNPYEWVQLNRGLPSVTLVT